MKVKKQNIRKNVIKRKLKDYNFKDYKLLISISACK